MFDIGIDLDGVVFDFGKSFRKYVLDSGIRTEDQCSRVLEMDFYLKWGISHDEFKEICHAGVDAGVIFYYGDPFPDARKALEDLRYYGNKVHIITDRTFGKDNYSHTLTKLWLAEHEIPYDTLTFSADKASVSTDIMIDDKLSNYDDLVDAECYPYLYDRPWNQTPNDVDRRGVPRRRVGSLQEFVDAVQWHMFEEQEQYSYSTYGEAEWI